MDDSELVVNLEALDDGRTVQWVLEGDPSIGVGSRQSNSPAQAAPSPRALPPPPLQPSPGRITPASQRSPPSWAKTPVHRPTPSPDYSPTGSLA